jgi:hypothetical protein
MTSQQCSGDSWYTQPSLQLQLRPQPTRTNNQQNKGACTEQSQRKSQPVPPILFSLIRFRQVSLSFAMCMCCMRMLMIEGARPAAGGVASCGHDRSRDDDHGRGRMHRRVGRYAATIWCANSEVSIECRVEQ